MSTKFPILRQYDDHWATYDFIKLYLCDEQRKMRIKIKNDNKNKNKTQSKKKKDSGKSKRRWWYSDDSNYDYSVPCFLLSVVTIVEALVWWSMLSKYHCIVCEVGYSESHRALHSLMLRMSCFRSEHHDRNLEYRCLLNTDHNTYIERIVIFWRCSGIEWEWWDRSWRRRCASVATQTTFVLIFDISDRVETR